ncbi:unnamed protein product [Microthlaspi erraticum]|uniref:RING-type domain-containing protein n=1 Tax=Microthlaspi erraticum TaxID=1685480 RepID=A0A6D2HB27_9BRAS|nr:unnamed protein product [Microthlaspi erraticum]
MRTLISCCLCLQCFSGLGTVCKKCIEKKFNEENLNACPVCNVDLGVAPLTRLTADSHLEHMMSRYFVPKPESVKPGPPLQYSRKKKSLLASTSNAESLPEPNTDAPMEAEKLGEKVKDLVLQNQRSSSVSRKRPGKNPSPQSLSTKAKELAVAPTSSECMQDDEELTSLVDRVDNALSISPEIEERYSLRSRIKKNMNPSGEGSSQGTKKKLKTSGKPVWFRLVAMENQGTSNPLAQIGGTPNTWFKADGNVSALLVMKMIVQKLSLESELDVELFLRGEQVSSTQKLQTLEDWWVVTTPIEEQESAMAGSSGARVGSSGADFVMVIHYSRSLLFH